MPIEGLHDWIQSTIPRNGGYCGSGGSWLEVIALGIPWNPPHPGLFTRGFSCWMGFALQQYTVYCSVFALNSVNLPDR